jgi:hypothetical protein
MTERLSYTHFFIKSDHEGGYLDHHGAVASALAAHQVAVESPLTIRSWIKEYTRDDDGRDIGEQIVTDWRRSGYTSIDQRSHILDTAQRRDHLPRQAQTPTFSAADQPIRALRELVEACEDRGFDTDPDMAPLLGRARDAFAALTTVFRIASNGEYPTATPEPLRLILCELMSTPAGNPPQ